jgi:hypothetical protein
MGKDKVASSLLKKSGEKAKSGKKNVIVTAEKQLSAKKEIDQLFDSAPKKQSKVEENVFCKDTVKETSFSKPRKDTNEATYGIMKSNSGLVITNPEAPLERIDAESGLPVYKAHLLKVGEGGGTPLCPFDCNCCF